MTDSTLPHRSIQTTAGARTKGTPLMTDSSGLSPGQLQTEIGELIDLACNIERSDKEVAK